MKTQKTTLEMLAKSLSKAKELSINQLRNIKGGNKLPDERIDYSSESIYIRG